MEIRSVTYQCPNCAAALEFDNTLGKHKCKFCDSVFDEQEIQRHFAENEQMKLEQADPELTDLQREQEEFTGASALYTCPNCGAGVICGELEASVRCHFCHTPVILSGRLSGSFKPDVIIPFSVSRQDAEKAFQEYTKGKFLLPKGFKSKAQIKEISSLYVPYWMKSGIARVSVQADCKKIKTWRVGDMRYTNTKYYQSSRDGEFTFIRVPCDGSKRIDDTLMESIEPFNYSGIKKFSMSYLSGCAAEKYDVSSAAAEQRIDQRIREAAVELLKQDMKAQGYDSISTTSADLRFPRKTVIYAMLPVWFLNYQYNGKDYPFVMNGQTGNRFGILPVSKLRSFLFGAGVFLAALLLFGGVSWFMG